MAIAEPEQQDFVELKNSTRPKLFHGFVSLLFCLLAGIVFGFAMEKGRVFEPLVIREQMVFERWIMMKMFLGAMASGMLSLAALSVVPIQFLKQHFQSAFDEYESSIIHKNAIALAIGAFVLGLGMTLSGACPGMVLPQVGAWAAQSIWTLVGALLGALVYGLLHDRIYQKIFPSDKLTLPSTAAKLLGMRHVFLALPMGVIVGAVVVVLEVVVPWKSEVDWYQYDSPYKNENQTADGTIFQYVAWPPFVCGILIGLMQVTIVLAARSTLGGSSSYCTVVSQWLLTASIREKFPYLANFRCGLSNWWQVVYVCGGICGGAISAALSQTIGQVPGVPIPFALFGGFFLVFGARIASGCTSGHGLSGTSMLFLGSFLAVPCMFAGAISSAFILKAAGELDNVF